MPITRGSTPATALPTNAPSGSTPSSRARSSLAITSAAAPSLIPLALPAVTVPPSRNAGSARRASRRSCRDGGARRARRSPTGTSSSAKRPASWAAAQRLVRLRARTRPGPRARRRSARRRSRRSRPSTRAGTAPPGAGWGSASRASCRTPSVAARERLLGLRQDERRAGHRLDAARDEEIAVAGDDRVAGGDDRRETRRAEPVDRDAGTDSGKPASSAAIRATLRLSSPAWFAQPK